MKIEVTVTQKVGVLFFTFKMMHDKCLCLNSQTYVKNMEILFVVLWKFAYASNDYFIEKCKIHYFFVQKIKIFVFFF